MRPLLAFGFAAVVAVAVCGCGSSGTVVARVGDDPISASLLEHWEAIDAAVQGKPPGDRSASMPRALGFLIFSRWLAGEARKQGVEVSDGQAREQLEVLAFDQRESLPFLTPPRDAQLRAYLVSSKPGRSDRLWLMKLALLAGRLEQRRLTQALGEVTHMQIASFYAHDKRRFWRPERRNLEVIGNQSLRIVDQAKREIQAGASFLSVARRVSTDQEAPGGLEHPLARGEEEPQYDAHVFSAPPHKLMGPIDQTFYYIFEVLKISRAHIESLSQAESAIRLILAQRRASTQLVARFERAWRAKTSCRRGYVTPRCPPAARIA
jgi:foldase protein PrsA